MSERRARYNIQVGPHNVKFPSARESRSSIARKASQLGHGITNQRLVEELEESCEVSSGRREGGMEVSVARRWVEVV